MTRSLAYLLAALLMVSLGGLSGCGDTAKKKTYENECPPGTKQSVTSEKIYRIVSCLDSAGKKQGKEIVWHEDGPKVGEHQYQDGKKHGTFTFWYESGKVKAVSEYRDGKPNGVWTSYYENGQKERVVHVRDGKRHGKITEWDEGGDLTKAEQCDMGACTPVK